MSARRVRSLFISIFCLMVVASIHAAASDPFLGTWKLDVARSKYPNGTCPKSMVIEMRAAPLGVWYHSDATYKNDSQIHAEYTAGYDGRQVTVRGDRGLLLPVSLKRPSSRAVIATYTRGMLPVATSRRVVSDDGKWMTITTTSLDAAGKKWTTLGVYRRELADRGSRTGPAPRWVASRVESKP